MEGSVTKRNGPALAGLIVGLLAIAALAFFFPTSIPKAGGLIVRFGPTEVLGVLALTLGVMGLLRARKGHGRRELAAIAVTLGLVVVLGAPWAHLVSGSGEEYGRQCATNPSDPDC